MGKIVTISNICHKVKVTISDNQCNSFVSHFIDFYLMVIGGAYPRYPSEVGDDVELVSLDPINYPVPDCLQNLNPLPAPIFYAGGATGDGINNVNVFASEVQADSSAPRPELGFSCSTVCPVMLGLTKIWQKRLCKMVEQPNQSQLNPGLRADESPCNICYVSDGIPFICGGL